MKESVQVKVLQYSKSYQSDVSKSPSLGCDLSSQVWMSSMDSMETVSVMRPGGVNESADVSVVRPGGVNESATLSPIDEQKKSEVCSNCKKTDCMDGKYLTKFGSD